MNDEMRAELETKLAQQFECYERSELVDMLIDRDDYDSDYDYEATCDDTFASLVEQVVDKTINDMEERRA